MRMRRHLVWGSMLAVACVAPSVASAQSVAGKPPGATRPTAYNLPLQHQSIALYAITPRISSPLAPLVNFQNAEIKFNLQTLMNTLRDNRHEGWVLAAYPDPKTTRPLIGAGFSLDLEAREHLQRDPLNTMPFLEPSSAQLWQAAGLQPAQLDSMLDQYDRELETWKKARFRRKIRTNSLFPEISEEDATALLRISAIQAVHNARAYCRYFDEWNGPQQMALSQMVFQMGVNLEEFTNFLSAVNNPPNYGAPLAGSFASDADYWKSVQDTLIHTDWARRYSTRAVSVIAMFDPIYASDPYEAESRVRAEVHPLHSRHRRRAATLRTASVSHKKSSARRTHKS
jgi:hypothetical protein